MSQGETKAATLWQSVTPSDSADVNFRAIWITTAGNVALRDRNDNDVTFTVAASTLLPVQPKRILSTGTTATGIVGLN